MKNNYSILNSILKFFKNKISFATVVFFLIFTVEGYAQCSTPVVGCANTNLSNFGYASNNVAATIEYDSFISSFHSTVVRTSTGGFQVWGEDMGNNGTADILSPLAINNTNFPAIGSSIPLKAGLGSNSANVVQGILLTTDGLYAWSSEGVVIDNAITSSVGFQKITVNGATNGLPPGVVPGDVKMMFATYRTLVITTCNGNAWVLSQDAALRADGLSGSSLQWSQVRTSATGNPVLTDVVVCRGTAGSLMALTGDGSVYVWGTNVYLGNGTALIPSQTYATKMTLPLVGSNPITPKMIGATNSAALASFYILDTTGNLYGLGENSNRQLGDWTTTDRTGWVQPKYTSALGPVMNDIKWISPKEHDLVHGAINVLNNSKQLYAFGENNTSMIGATGASSNPVIPSGVTASDLILGVETGGHTTMIVKQCAPNFGYVGHKIRGSMGDGLLPTQTITSFTFATAPVQICGIESLPVIQPISFVNSVNGNYCLDALLLVESSPAGGVLSVVSGPGVLTGNTLQFSGVGTVTLQYVLTDACGGTTSVVKEFVSEICPNDLQIIKSINNNAPIVGNAVTFTITATNNGPYNATGVSVVDAIPAGYSVTSVTPSIGTWTAPNWIIGNLANGASATLTVVATVNATGSYTNTAQISSPNQPDPNILNNTSTVTPNPCAPKPINSTVTQPNCTISTGSFTITNYNSAFTYTVNPSVGVTISNIGVVTAPAGTYTVTATLGTCNSVSASIVVNPQPIPAAPTVGTITQPTCAVATGSVVLTGLPAGNWTINPGNITGNTATTTISGLTAGTYTYTVTNSVGCISVATVNVVMTNLICANDDTPVTVIATVPSGAVDTVVGTVLTNDTLNGIPVTTSNTNVTPVTDGPLSVDSDGNVTVAANTPSGTYTITYVLCEADPITGLTLNPTNCNDAIATVVVANTIIANNDAPQVVEINVPGAIVVGSVIINDTLNGVVVTTTNTDVTPTTEGPLSIDANGIVTVAAGTPAGTYTITYTICETGAVPANCDTATATFIIVTDTDGDGVINITEIENGTDPYNFCDFIPANVTEEQSQAFLDADCDLDGLTNGEEYGPDPTDPLDSDGDGIPDFLEPNNSTPSEDDLEIFNLVTPNGDSDNDVFTIRNIELYPNNTVEIYNRWGVLVYETKGYGQNGKYFRGISEGRVTISQSSELPVGTYFYILRYQNNSSQNKERSGYLYINR